MTLEGARATAQGMADRFNKPFVVYRFPGWTAGEWGVIAKSRELADTAEIRETFEPPRIHRDRPEQGGLF